MKLNKNDPVGECGGKKWCDKASVHDEESTSRDLWVLPHLQHENLGAKMDEHTQNEINSNYFSFMCIVFTQSRLCQFSYNSMCSLRKPWRENILFRYKAKAQ